MISVSVSFLLVNMKEIIEKSSARLQLKKFGMEKPVITKKITGKKNTQDLSLFRRIKEAIDFEFFLKLHNGAKTIFKYF